MSLGLAALVIAAFLLASCSTDSVTSPEASTASDTTETTTTALASQSEDPEPTTSTADDAAGGGSDQDRSPPTTDVDTGQQSVASTIAPEFTSCRRIEDFGVDARDRWVVVNDEVMGGRSVGEAEIDGSIIRFSGTINTDGGGFSLVRTSTLRDGQRLDEALAGADYLRFRVRSANGRGYEFIAEDSVSSSQVMHFAPVSVNGSGLWEELAVPLDDLEARSFGTLIINQEPFRLDQVTSIGLILADSVDGPFSLEVDRIDACQR